VTETTTTGVRTTYWLYTLKWIFIALCPFVPDFQIANI
jgi:hypothetical protein